MLWKMDVLLTSIISLMLEFLKKNLLSFLKEKDVWLKWEDMQKM